jgi:hypothetical protein
MSPLQPRMGFILCKRQEFNPVNCTKLTSYTSESILLCQVRQETPPEDFFQILHRLLELHSVTLEPSQWCKIHKQVPSLQAVVSVACHDTQSRPRLDTAQHPHSQLLSTLQFDSGSNDTDRVGSRQQLLEVRADLSHHPVFDCELKPARPCCKLCLRSTDVCSIDLLQ